MQEVAKWGNTDSTGWGNHGSYAAVAQSYLERIEAENTLRIMLVPLESKTRLHAEDRRIQSKILEEAQDFFSK